MQGGNEQAGNEAVTVPLLAAADEEVAGNDNIPVVLEVGDNNVVPAGGAAAAVAVNMGGNVPPPVVGNEPIRACLCLFVVGVLAGVMLLPYDPVCTVSGGLPAATILCAAEVFCRPLANLTGTSPCVRPTNKDVSATVAVVVNPAGAKAEVDFCGISQVIQGAGSAVCVSPHPSSDATAFTMLSQLGVKADAGTTVELTATATDTPTSSGGGGERMLSAPAEHQFFEGSATVYFNEMMKSSRPDPSVLSRATAWLGSWFGSVSPAAESRK